MDPETLARAGQLLLGPEWQRPMARLLGPRHPGGIRESLDPRLIQRWASGERPVAAWVPGVLADLLAARSGQLRAAAKECETLAAALRDIEETDDLRPGA
ncbi:hypothetical protein ACFOYU_09955 [Microvirga sp. GCM10011540]|uniref:hypothetical protein n=1 Tax=Microvirga sp. GCM10011540 TaxID=3317338 RepID=UPI003608BF8E